MNITIKINTGNAALPLRDINGNRVGEFKTSAR